MRSGLWHERTAIPPSAERTDASAPIETKSSSHPGPARKVRVLAVAMERRFQFE